MRPPGAPPRLAPGARAPAQRSPPLGRVFGLKALVVSGNCSRPNVLALDTSHDWPVYVSPGILLLLYYTATSLLKLRPRPPPDQVSPCARRPPRSGPLAGGELSVALVPTEAGGGRERRRAGGGADSGGSVASGPGQGCSHQGGGGRPGREPGRSALRSPPAHGLCGLGSPGVRLLLQRVLATATGSDRETGSCTVHDLTGHSAVRQRPREWTPPSAATLVLPPGGHRVVLPC